MNNLLIVLQLLNGSDYLKAFETNQLHAQVMLSLNAFTDGWNIGLAIFGLHLLIIGYLVFRSGYLPKFLGILVVIAGLGYLIPGFYVTQSVKKRNKKGKIVIIEKNEGI